MFQVHILDLNTSNASELFHIIAPQCLQCIRTIPYYWTSMPPMPQSYSIFWTSGDGDDGGGGGGFPRTLESGRSPGPTCPGTKYPVRGIPHFDHLWLFLMYVTFAILEQICPFFKYAINCSTSPTFLLSTSPWSLLSRYLGCLG